jgi:hypothetical protein
MKSLKTYNMDQDCIQILQHKPNKSQYVCRSIRRMQKLEEELDLNLIGTRYLLINLKHRDISEALKTLIELELSTSI